MDRINFVELSEEELTLVAGGHGHHSQVNFSGSYQSASAYGSADGGSYNGNFSADAAGSLYGDAAAGGNANGNGGTVGAGNSNKTKQFNFA